MNIYDPEPEPCECCGAIDDIRLQGETFLCPNCPSVYGRCPCGFTCPG